MNAATQTASLSATQRASRLVNVYTLVCTRDTCGKATVQTLSLAQARTFRCPSCNALTKPKPLSHQTDKWRLL